MWQDRVEQFLRAVRRSIASWFRADSFGAGASMAFYALFAFAPILVLVTSIAASVVGGEQVQTQVSKWTGTYIGPDGSDLIKEVIRNPKRMNISTFGTLLSAIVFLFSTSAVFLRLKREINNIWGVLHETRSIIHKLLLDRIMAIVSAFAMGLLLLVGIIASVGISMASSYISKMVVKVPGGLIDLVTFIGALIILAPFFAAIYKILPSKKVSWRVGLTSGVFISIMFNIGTLIIGWYLRNNSVASIYGPAGSFLAFMIWVYYSVQSVLFGVHFSREYMRELEKAKVSDSTMLDAPTKAPTPQNNPQQ